MNSSTLRINSIVQARVDAFLKEMFDICQSSEDEPKAKSLWGTIATELTICDAVGVAIRRRRNERILFAHLATDIVHSIFGIALDVDQVHNPCLPLAELDENRRQLFYMRQVSSAWNDFLLSSPRYWQAINITSPPQVITTSIERSGSAPLCIYCFRTYSPEPRPIHLPEELRRSCAKVQTLRSEDSNTYGLCRSLLRDPAPALQTLQLTGPLVPPGGDVEPLGDLPSIYHLTAVWWQPPSDAVWLLGLKELDLYHTSEPNMEVLRVLSACPNLERLTIVDKDDEVIGDPPGVISPITLPRLQSMRLDFISNESAMKLTRRLIAPQCFRRTLSIKEARHLGQYVADYRRFMFMEESCTQDPRSACVHIKGFRSGTILAYEADSRQLVFGGLPVEEVSAVHGLVQELQQLFKGPLLTVTIDYLFETAWSFLRPLSDQNIRNIVAHFRHSGRGVDDLFKVIGAGFADIPEGTTTNNATDWLSKSLRSIEIHNTSVNLDDFPRLVEEYLHKSSKALLEEIVLVGCGLAGPEFAQAAERLAAIGITIRDDACSHY
ncbi:hypothetical protein M407DRAFT_22113 [Tulasnella calospora MUT 4182]|uniref:F-box domain-containing protein n=1 Tax=Tulasnella calospora MUT 4182 TaxID=1051891 RepID=A0A0C3QLV7_9AGAM|nr:hypothetical protein M407DRAFT_22113 [Tulasnella calospora MUT 4182]